MVRAPFATEAGREGRRSSGAPLADEGKMRPEATLAGHSRECDETRNPARKTVRRRAGEMDRAWRGLHGHLGIKAVAVWNQPRTRDEKTTPRDWLPEARAITQKNSRGVRTSSLDSGGGRLPPKRKREQGIQEW